MISPLLIEDLSHLSISSKFCLSIFYSTLEAEKAKVLVATTLQLNEPKGNLPLVPNMIYIRRYACSTGSPGGSVVQNLPADAGEACSIPG